MIHELKKDIYLLLHKKVFLLCLIIFSVLFSYISLKDITNIYTSGYSYQHHFIIAIDYAKHSFLSAFYYLIPVIVVFPFADTWLNERKMTDILFTRVKAKTYFLSKYILCFVSGFLVLALPLLISFIAEIFALDFHENQITILPYAVGENNIQSLNQMYSFFSFYSSSPYLYMIMYFALIGIYGGFCAMTSFSISLICKQKVIPYIAMFLILLLPMFVSSYLPDPYAYWYPQMLINPFAQNAELTPLVYAMWYALCLLANAVMFKMYQRRDIFE